MSLAFPDDWSGLRFPHVRAELLNYLKDATKPDLCLRTHEVEFLVHFMFDDHDFGPNDTNIGDILFDSEEASALLHFVETLDRAIGPRTKQLSELTLDDWNPVAKVAEETYSHLARNGLPHYG